MNRLRFYRIERGLSQLELAQASGIGRWAIQLIEIGARHPSTDELEALSCALAIPESKIYTLRKLSNQKVSFGETHD